MVRNAAEMQEMLTACRTTFGWDEDRALEAGFNDSELVSAGFREAPEHPTEEQIGKLSPRFFDAISSVIPWIPDTLFQLLCY